jgi:hypothetical protein
LCDRDRKPTGSTARAELIERAQQIKAAIHRKEAFGVFGPQEEDEDEDDLPEFDDEEDPTPGHVQQASIPVNEEPTTTGQASAGHSSMQSTSELGKRKGSDLFNKTKNVKITNPRSTAGGALRELTNAIAESGKRSESAQMFELMAEQNRQSQSQMMQMMLMMMGMRGTPAPTSGFGYGNQSFSSSSSGGYRSTNYNGPTYSSSSSSGTNLDQLLDSNEEFI